MADNFLNHVLKTGVASLCQAIGWNSTQTTAVDILSDLWKRQMLQMAKLSTNYAMHYGRTEVTLDDTALAFRDLNLSTNELEEYVQNFDSVQLPYCIPNFPLPKESNLNFLRPGSEEVLTRPVHVHEYMPPWNSSTSVEDSTDRINKNLQEQTPSSSSDNENDTLSNRSKVSRQEDSPSSKSKNVLVPSNLEKESNVESTSDNISNVNGVKEDSNNQPELPNSTPPQGMTAVTPQSSKSSKRLDSPGENPALKRVRLLLEEEGHVLREVKSAMMTTSGFLSSSAEGRLPESRPPPNRDFFEPAPVEKKKKIPTMKKIVEGIKKLDKEKENQNVKLDDEECEEGANLFSNPDKIQKISKSVKENLNEDNEPKKHVSEKEKEKSEKDKLKALKKASRKFKSLEKIAKGKHKLHKKSELQLEKRKKSSEAKTKVETFEDDNQRLEVVPSQEIKREPSPTAKFIKDRSSAFAKAAEKADLLRKSSKKVRAQKILLEKVKKDKKYKTRESFVALEHIDDIIQQPSTSTTGTNVLSLPFVTTDEPIAKKKRGRPKKNPEADIVKTPEAPFLPPPTVTLTPEKERPVKMEKIKKKIRPSSMLMSQSEVDMLTPEISINVSNHPRPPPPPPEFNMILGRLPMQPGLIPTSFAPPPSSMRHQQSQFSVSPSISITPSTPDISLTPLTSQDLAAASTSSLGVPPNVCSSITITRINMSDSSQQRHTPTIPSSSNIPGLSSNSMSISITKESKPTSSPKVPVQPDNSSGITITPIVMTKHLSPPEFSFSQSQGELSRKRDKVDLSAASSRPDDDVRTKEQRRKDREKRKELKKEKKKEKKLKEKQKSKGEKLVTTIKSERFDEFPEKKEKKDKEKKKKIKDSSVANISPAAGRSEGMVPKLKLKLHSNVSTPIDSPRPGSVDRNETPPPRKITIKPIEESIKRRTPSPELARFSPLVTRPAKTHKVNLPLKSPPIPKTPQPAPSDVVCFPPIDSTGSGKRGRKPGRGRPAKASQSGLVTETVGFYIDGDGNKVWICPACGRCDDGSPMIGCDTCDDWYHFLCVGILDTPDETESWFCARCTSKRGSSSGMSADHKKRIPKL